MKVNRDKLIIISLLISKIILHIYWDYFFTYDHNRNLLVIKDLVNYGTYTYFGYNFVINPPLFFIIYSLFGLFIGVSHFSMQFIGLLIYFLASIIIYKIVELISKSRDAPIIAFIITFLNPTSLLIEEIDFFAINLLMSSLLLLTYLLFIKNQSIKNALILGLIAGLSMLTKDSFIIFLLLLVIHYLFFSRFNKNSLISILTALITYLPWVSYLLLNNLPMPWQSHAGELSGNLSWGGELTTPFYHAFYLLLINWPVLFLLSIIYCFIGKNKLLKTIIIIGPIIVRLILHYFVIDHIYFLFIALPIASSLLIVNKRLKNYSSLIITAITISFIINNYNTLFINGSFTRDSCDFIDFLHSLKPSDSVIVDELNPIDYTHFALMSNARFEHVNSNNYDFFVMSIIRQGANLFITNHSVNLPLLYHFNCVVRGVNNDYFVYSIPHNSSMTIKVVSDGKPLSNAVLLFVINNSSIIGLTSNDGSYDYFIPVRPSLIKAYRVGFNSTTIINPKNDLIVINLKRLPLFTTGYNFTRY